MIFPPPNVTCPPFVAAKAVDSPELSTLAFPAIWTIPPLSANAANPFIVAFPVTFIFVPAPSA
ncbi:hypothetical protein [Fusobacterium simiae]|uniref:hypothetical protein n=1 Tax=Fusobacterium simiae TaxID=855 RepID=UPI002E14E004